MDEVDLAQRQSEAMLELSIARRRKEAFVGQGSEICIDCGELIPEARRLALPNAKRCVECQTQYERTHG